MPEALSTGGLRALNDVTGTALRLGSDQSGNLEITFSGDAHEALVALQDIAKYLERISTHFDLIQGEL